MCQGVVYIAGINGLPIASANSYREQSTRPPAEGRGGGRGTAAAAAAAAAAAVQCSSSRRCAVVCCVWPLALRGRRRRTRTRRRTGRRTRRRRRGRHRHARPHSSRTAVRLTATACWPRGHWADCATVLSRTVSPESRGRRRIAWSCCPCWRRACAGGAQESGACGVRNKRSTASTLSSPACGHLGRAELLHTRSSTHGRRGGSTTSGGSNKLARHRGGHLSSTSASSCTHQCNGARSRLARHPSWARLARPAKQLPGLRRIVRDNGFLSFCCGARWSGSESGESSQ